MKNVTRAFSGRQTVNPKTSLGFYGTIIVAVIAGNATLCGVLAATPYGYTIPWILLCSLALVLFTVGAVVVINYMRPQNLMLGQISGSEYKAIEEVVSLGDSRNGERRIRVGTNDRGLDTLSDQEPNSVNDIHELMVDPRESDSGNDGGTRA